MSCRLWLKDKADLFKHQSDLFGKYNVELTKEREKSKEMLKI